MIAGRKLLVADDSPTYRKLLDLTFADEGMEVTLASDGREAWGILEQASPDLVIADVFMPQFSGYELCKLIKQDERFARIPVILLVGLHEPFDETEARRAGADDVVTKPFQSIRSLVSRVGSLLGGKAESAADDSQAHGYSTLGLGETNAVPAAASEEATPEPNIETIPKLDVEATPEPDEEATPEPNVTVFVEAATLPETEAAEPVEPAGSTCPADIELQTADTMRMERINLEPPAVEPIAYAQDETAEMPAVIETDEREDSSAARHTSETAAATGAPEMSEHATPQLVPAPNPATFDEGLLDLGDFESPPARAITEDVILDLDYEEFVGEPLNETVAMASEPVAESSMAFESTYPVEAAAPRFVPEEAPADEGATMAEYQEWAIVTPASITEAPAESSEAPTQELARPKLAQTEEMVDTGQTTSDAGLSLSPETIDAIARRTVEHLSERVVREIAWEVVPELAELLIKKKLEEEKS